MNAKKIMMAWVLVLALSLSASASDKESGLEGKVVDGAGKPIAGLKIIAEQLTPIKGYERFESVTGSDGTFKFNKLYPSSKYILKPWSDKWTTEMSLTVQSGKDGKTIIRSSPMTIRFTISSGGVINDSKTGLQWVVGPDQDISYNDAVAWVKACKVDGGGWRMPTREELSTLWIQGSGERNLDPVFKTTGLRVWAELKDLLSAWPFNFNPVTVRLWNRTFWDDKRVFGVRSLPRR